MTVDRLAVTNHLLNLTGIRNRHEFKKYLSCEGSFQQGSMKTCQVWFTSEKST